MAEENAVKDQQDEVIKILQSTLISSYLAHREKLNIVKRRDEAKGNLVYRSRTGKEEQISQLLIRRLKLDRYFESLYDAVYDKSPEELPSYEEINGKSMIQMGSMLGAEIQRFERVIGRIADRFNAARVVKEKVDLSEGYYSKFTNWYKDYYEIGKRAEALKAELLKPETEFSLNGTSDFDQVIAAINIEYMTLIEALKEEQKEGDRILLSPEISEFVALSEMLDERRMLAAYGPQLKGMSAGNYLTFEPIVKSLLTQTQNVNKTKDLIFKMVDLKNRTSKKLIRDWLPKVWNSVVQEAINEYIQAQQKAQASEVKDLDEGIDEEATPETK
ncbi:MAG: hypothetical protein ACTSYA_01185 [Candidatus Kariarchaeaceae archaeon]